MTMSFEYDEKGKYFTDVIKKEVVLTQIHTRTVCIQGYIHIRVGERLSDEINRNTLFLPVTNAEVFSLDGELLYSTNFLAVNREQVVWLAPLEKHDRIPG
jgi:hypothetical protein